MLRATQLDMVKLRFESGQSDFGVGTEAND